MSSGRRGEISLLQAMENHECSSFNLRVGFGIECRLGNGKNRRKEEEGGGRRRKEGQESEEEEEGRKRREQGSAGNNEELAF
jgi:hypothetical protein